LTQEGAAWSSEKLMIQDTGIDIFIFMQNKELAKTIQLSLIFNSLYSIELRNFMPLFY
jgi:hypothetical protein